MSEGPGFLFWGLFLACLGVVLAYAGWMVWVERRERANDGRERPSHDAGRSG